MGTKLIKRFLTPFAPLRPEPYKVTLDWGTAMESSTGERFKRNVAEPAVQLAHSVTKPIVDQYTKAQKRNKLTSALQLALWNNGFFKGLKDRRGRDVTYETAVDGLKGSMTNLAIEAAKAAGYIINKDGSLTKMSDLTGDMIKNAPAPRTTPRQVTQTPVQLEQVLLTPLTSLFSGTKPTTPLSDDSRINGLSLDLAKQKYLRGEGMSDGIVSYLFHILAPESMNLPLSNRVKNLLAAEIAYNESNHPSNGLKVRISYDTHGRLSDQSLNANELTADNNGLGKTLGEYWYRVNPDRTVSVYDTYDHLVVRDFYNNNAKGKPTVYVGENLSKDEYMGSPVRGLFYDISAPNFHFTGNGRSFLLNLLDLAENFSTRQGKVRNSGTTLTIDEINKRNL